MLKSSDGRLFAGRLTAVLALLCTISYMTTDIMAADWPIYKGNIYFTGNNDEIVVKNNNLKWLFESPATVFNPIVSDGKVYFLDIKKNVYCLDEEEGKLLWKLDLLQVSAQFNPTRRPAGKVKYPLVKGDTLYVSDSYAIYAIDKNNGTVRWARTGMPEEHYARTSGAMVDGIYSDPFVSEDAILYGTRNVFMSRELRNGRTVWNNSAIGSYSGFPTFYDRYVLTQSMDFGKDRYRLLPFRGQRESKMGDRNRKAAGNLPAGGVQGECPYRLRRQTLLPFPRERAGAVVQRIWRSYHVQSRLHRARNNLFRRQPAYRFGRSGRWRRAARHRLR